MKKLVMTSISLFMAMLFLFTSGYGQRKSRKKSKYTPVENIVREEAWPIVAQAVSALGLFVESFDYGKGELKTSYYEYKKGFIANRGKILFLLKDNVLSIDVVDLQLKDAQTKKWKPTYPDPLFPKEKQIKAEIADAVRLIHGDEEKKGMAMKGFANNYYFHDRFYGTATELAAELWFDQFLKDKDVKWVLRLENIQKSSKEGFKFHETFKGYGENAVLVVERFTQSDANAFVNKGDKVSIEGKCVKMEKGDKGWRVVLHEE